MSAETFFEFYRKLSSAETEPSEYQTVFDQLALLCRDRQQNGSTPDEWLRDVDHCLHQIAESSHLFAEAVSSWLTTNEDIKLGKALAEKASVKHLRQSAVTGYDLSKIEEGRAILTGCRLCASYVTPAVTLGWALSLATAYPNSKKAAEAVNHLLSYHIDEFPWTTQRLLASEESAFKSLSQVIEALATLNEQQSWLEALPRLRELSMTQEMRLTLSSLKRRESRSIHRHAKEKSVFSQLFATQHFKYANKTAIEFAVDNQTHETTLEMSPYSVSAELPVSEYIDPELGLARRRALWRGEFR
ncbi:hypothetical protein [Azonexus sp. IMCC34839]|uniref:hypothetical protein n=1 Tax=Azonexus sp. IMCC34839 TaxID=3133695 RepID=UPI00399A1DB7